MWPSDGAPYQHLKKDVKLLIIFQQHKYKYIWMIIFIQNYNSSLFDSCKECNVLMDFKYSHAFSDDVIWSVKPKWLAEWTNPFEENIDCIYQHRLRNFYKRNSWKTNIFPMLGVMVLLPSLSELYIIQSVAYRMCLMWWC